LDQFKKYFAAYSNHYILIGGTACSVIMEDVGLVFRATKDLDIVLCVEALDAEFVSVFWDFVRDGGYCNQQRSTGKKIYYRFYSPSNSDFPEMLELFSRIPNSLSLDDYKHIIPIPMDEEASSLSAILMNDDYYNFIHNGKRELNGVSLVCAEHLIPLKARAWLDMSARIGKGELEDSRDVRKHKNDVARLYQILSADTRIELPDSVKQDMKKFIKCIKKSEDIDMKNLGLKNTTFDEMLSNLNEIYELELEL